MDTLLFCGDGATKRCCCAELRDEIVVDLENAAARAFFDGPELDSEVAAQLLVDVIVSMESAARRSGC